MDIFKMVTTLLGGLAVFIYGMNLMSDGLQKAAGDKMRRILSLLTANPILGVLAGAIVTAVLQSSSATTVMVIGFVSAGLMKLRQAISVVLGANIGTTITAQLVAFDIGDYAWIFVFVGFIMFFFIKKKEIICKIGEIFFGFGLLFVGINIMGDTMEPLASSPLFSDILTQVADTPVLGVIVGALMTLLVQSSSATIAVLQNLASTAGPDGINAVISLQGAIPILFGTNIGTTITAILASIGGTINAKRTAVAHTIFNVVGTLIFIWFVPQLVDLVSWITPGSGLQAASRQLANTHMLFNVVNTLIFLPFIWLLVKIVEKIIPGKEKEIETSNPKYLDDNVLEQPVFATHLAVQELVRNAHIVKEMLVDSRVVFKTNDQKLAKEILERDEIVNALRTKTIEYLAKILAAESITEYQKNKVSALMHVASDIEHIGDYSKNLVILANDKHKYKYEFSENAISEITEYYNMMEVMIEDTINALASGKPDLAINVLIQERDMNELEAKIRKEHMNRVEENTCSPAVTVTFLDLIHNIERSADSCKNIAEAVLKGYEAKKLSENLKEQLEQLDEYVEMQ